MSAKLLRFNEAHIYQRWETIPRDLKSEATQWVYLGPDGSRWDLAGRHEGRQGVILNKELQGAYHLPFEHLLTESAYQVGATYERSNINKRIISFGVILGGPKYKSHAYRMIEANWWNAWPHDTPGWLGCHTKFGGWRWAQVQLAEAVKTSITTDATAFGNNIMHWDMKALAPKPWYAKRTLVETWKAHPETVMANGFDEETIAIANRAHLAQWPIFIYSGPGRAWVQDGMTDRMVPLPVLSADDGYVLVDTDPANRTLTGSKDPVDNLFYDVIRSSRLLDFFLHDLAALGLPVWRRGGDVRFNSQIPPRTIANLKVRHDTANGTVITMLPQRYIRPS